jgi:hypothetical protein
MNMETNEWLRALEHAHDLLRDLERLVGRADPYQRGIEA